MWWNSVIHTICGSIVHDGGKNIAMILKFVSHVQKSKKLKGYGELVEGDDIFSTDQLADLIVEKYNLEREDIVLMENLNRCLETLRIINVVYSKLNEMKRQAFDQYNESHASMLDCLWYSLKGCKRGTTGVVGAEWTEIGFQSSDPSTDFRSMGVLALYQLLYFAQRKTEAARLILSELSTPGRVYPFALVGIHMSVLTMELFLEKRLHSYIVQHFGNLTINAHMSCANGPSNDVECINFCSDLIHDLYCTAFEDFYLVWTIRKPMDMMSFQDLYGEVRRTMFDRFPPIS
mmetsp:Transcript_24533/g.40900  ORF Transcript_24533/g.40900 Transcript_24533/m.40900 type:complete len:290 (+) Transcript_24533:212-1081(+)|eukprot:CAMPEP_0174998174 /NCGR_PEP_ID=MMETSP0005-20121125/1356_1 /TAXON_ID=420556 /ORGANISM="Ochromonas sp., Strain CCMP1393" /LENGTH=289 /DNA_ID=CAMNT_0016252769 /DNA_START=101 /DNA_END=967 /DNA_ORIENTATION=-